MSRGTAMLRVTGPAVPDGADVAELEDVVEVVDDGFEDE
jgi:hypothetical protein